MPSSPRYAILQDFATFHVTWQCHNKEWLLESPWAKRFYLRLLKKYKKQYRIEFYHFCLMSNHPHLLGFCENARLLSDFFRLVNSLFARAYNKKFNRRGQVVMDRFKSPIIQTDSDLLQVMLYLDMNPVRAGMVKHPKQYPWSSHSCYADKKKHPLITLSPAYLRLGRSYQQRTKAYRRLVEKTLRWGGKRKLPYSKINFIGSKKWTQLKTQKLIKENKNRRTDWIKKFKKKFGRSPPSLKPFSGAFSFKNGPADQSMATGNSS